jgi:hypothetical protein
VLPPFGVTAVKLRGLHLLGTAFDMTYDAAQLCVQLQAGAPPAVPLELRVRASGQRLAISAAAPTCVAVGAVDVAGVGFEA